jgi:hypothetical protein
VSILVPVKYNIVTVLDIQASIFNWTYLRSNWWRIDKSVSIILHISCQILGILSGLSVANTGHRQIQYSYSSSYAAFNIHLNVSTSILVVYRYIDACYNPNLLPNTGHNIRFTLCQIWPPSNPMQLHFLIFSLQYSIERTSVDIGDMSTIQYALYSTFANKCSLDNSRLRYVEHRSQSNPI